MKLAIVGAFQGTHVGGSLARAAQAMGWEVVRFDLAQASAGSHLLGALRWRLGDRKPLRMEAFARSVVEGCRRERPDVLIATGAACLTAETLAVIKALGVVCLNYSTDDPWNRTARANWHIRALPAYDGIFTPRRANLADFQRLGCPCVEYLPFAYDETLLASEAGPDAGTAHDVLFVGGADSDRVAFMTAFMRAGPKVVLVGGYWDRYAATRPYAQGLKPPGALQALTAAAGVNLCLVRRANRDGHVMRSFEIAAIGGCMLVEDTTEHRELFGPDKECVVYFHTPAEAAERAKALVADRGEQGRLRAAVRTRMAQGRHTYRDRLARMLDAVPALRRTVNLEAAPC